MSTVSTFRPIDLGWVESSILYQFAKSKHLSAYSIFKYYKENRWEKPMAYKNIHKRIKRLEELRLIQHVEGNFERGAKPYEITTFGLLAFMSLSTSDGAEFIHHHKDNVIFKSLLLEYFEEKTIDSIRTLKDTNTGEMGEYMYECCSATRKTCSEIWNEITKYGLDKILPSDKIIQDYILYLDGRYAEESVLKEIEQYKKRLDDYKLKLQEDSKFDLEYEYYLENKFPYTNDLNEAKKDPKNFEPPFPFNYMYVELAYLDSSFEEKMKSFAFYLVTLIGGFAEYREAKNKEELNEALEGFGRDMSMHKMLNDKKLLALITDLKNEFDLGYRQFMHYHKI
ncbi:MAG: hypothetical protein L0H53_10865 [Candidatus Nitrosocosmicus sp.]|nr:hypothetical protein [Candidatus Nitrosocosmicus sp.]MDN5868808.1 hypothetical protein [Candidatus Nitrosocosmicus sp.]